MVGKPIKTKYFFRLAVFESSLPDQERSAQEITQIQINVCSKHNITLMPQKCKASKSSINFTRIRENSIYESFTSFSNLYDK